MILTSLRHHYANLLRFSGRDRPGLFWPSALVHVGLLFGVWTIALMWAMTELDVGVRPIPAIVRGLIIGGGILALLFASAVTRRLHDVGLRGWWALIPAALYTASGFVMLNWFAVGAGQQVEPSPLFMIGWLATMLYNISVLALIAVLCIPGKKVENRFGPPSDPPAG